MRKTLYSGNLRGLQPTGCGGVSVKKLVEVVLLLLMLVQCKKALVARSSAGVSSGSAAAQVLWGADEQKGRGFMGLARLK